MRRSWIVVAVVAGVAFWWWRRRRCGGCGGASASAAAGAAASGLPANVQAVRPPLVLAAASASLVPSPAASYRGPEEPPPGDELVLIGAGHGGIF